MTTVIHIIPCMEVFWQRAKCRKMQSKDKGVTVRVCVATGYLVICVNGLVEAHQLLSTLVVIACIDMPQHEHIPLTYRQCLMLMVPFKYRLCVDSDWVSNSESCACDETTQRHVICVPLCHSSDQTKNLSSALATCRVTASCPLAVYTCDSQSA